MRNFKQLNIWQEGFQIATNSFKITRSFPASERYGLTSQINRAAVSIPSNIAEGSSRTSQKEYKHFIEIALGSSFELETQLMIALKIGYDDQLLINETLIAVDREQKMLTAFLKVLVK